MILTKEEYSESRKRSNELAMKLRSSVATSDEEFEYETRDRAETEFKRSNPHKFKKWICDKSCDELGLMP
jgi:hypothetical protein